MESITPAVRSSAPLLNCEGSRFDRSAAGRAFRHPHLLSIHIVSGDANGRARGPQQRRVLNARRVRKVPGRGARWQRGEGGRRGWPRRGRRGCSARDEVVLIKDGRKRGKGRVARGRVGRRWGLLPRWLPAKPLIFRGSLLASHESAAATLRGVGTGRGRHGSKRPRSSR